jgi:pimeloyl-ACP methyl ester carboxylesterase
MNEERISFANSRGDVLVGILHHPVINNSTGAAILCHGMESHKNSQKLIFLGQELARRGIPALRFDFSYVGESSGKFADITYSGEVGDLRAAYALMRDRHGGKIAIFGSSMGGTVALMFAADEPDVAAVVTLAAPLHPENFPKRVLSPAGLERWRKRGYTRYNGQRLNLTMLEDLESIDAPSAARSIRCPVLILHGDADEVVPVAEAHELHDCLNTSKRLSILKDADHRLTDSAIMQRAMHEALDWLTDHVS